MNAILSLSLTISASSRQKSLDMNGWMVFICASGKRGVRKSTVSVEVADGVREYSGPFPPVKEYSGFEYSGVLDGTINEKTFILSRMVAGVTLPATTMACWQGLDAIMSNIIRRVVSDAAWS